MRVSIVTPVMNSINFIEACIENVVSQGDVVVEHIIADGGSTDGTVERVAELSRKYKHLRFVPGPDKGQSDAMNKATAVATGEVIGVLNVDDYYQPGAAAEAVKILATFNRPGIVVGDCKVVDENDQLKFWNRATDLRIESLLLGWHHAQFPSNPSAYFYHREVHDLVGGYDVKDHYAMDFDFILACAGKVQTRYTPSYWGNFRLMPGCKTYDDAQGPARVAELTAKHKRLLSPVQRARMQAMKTRSTLVHGYLDSKRILRRKITKAFRLIFSTAA